MRSVMALSPPKVQSDALASWLKVQAANRPAQQVKIIAPAVRWRHDERRWALRPRSCLCLDGRSPTARRARWTSLFSRRIWKPAETKKARSVVALSCVPRGVRGSPVSPPAAGRCSGRLAPGFLPRDIRFPRANPLVPGGCPASCPDAHRPARGHRHVRNWAGLTYVRPR